MVEVLIWKNQILPSKWNIVCSRFKRTTHQFLEPFHFHWARCRRLTAQPSGQGKFRSVQTGLIRDPNPDLSLPAPCNQETSSFKGLGGKNICEVASYLQPRLEELPSDISHGTAVAGTDQPAGDECFSPSKLLLAFDCSILRALPCLQRSPFSSGLMRSPTWEPWY